MCPPHIMMLSSQNRTIFKHNSLHPKHFKPVVLNKYASPGMCIITYRIATHNLNIPHRIVLTYIELPAANENDMLLAIFIVQCTYIFRP